jgi:hypothetical protein
MAILGTTALTLADWAARMDDNYKTATVVELLSQTNEVLDDMLFVEGNLPTGHKSTVRTGLPQGTWRLLNYGVPQGKSTTAQIVDTCGLLEAFSAVDQEIADLNGNTASFRMSESAAWLEGMTQQVASTLWYGNTSTNPERFMGFAPRYNTVVTASAQTGSAANLINALVRAGARLPTTPVGLSAVQTSDAPSIRGTMGRTVIYCNRTISTYLRLQAMNKTNVLLQLSEWQGRPITTFGGVPIRISDAILNTETRVV